MDQLLEEIATNLYNGEEDEIKVLVQRAIDQGINPQKILNEGLIGGMDRVGRDFKCGNLYLPEVLLAARAMHASMSLLRPLLVASEVPSVGKCVIGTVKGDVHDIGKNLVKMMLEGIGFEAIDLGTDVSPEAFVAAVQEHKPQIVGMSALLTTTMYEMKNTINALDQAGLRNSVKIMIGGAPLNDQFASLIGADSYAPDAIHAAETAHKFVV